MTKDSAVRLLDIKTGDLCPFFLSAGILPPDQFGVQRVVSGKGFSQDEARKNCAFEASERSAAILPPPNEVQSVWRSLDDISQSAIDPRELIMLSEEQYAGRQVWNPVTNGEFHIPPLFDPQMQIEWVHATELSSGKNVLVPAAIVYLGYQNPLGYGFPTPDSNGLASGNTPDSAVESACLELIERDAVSIWWYNELPKPALEVNAHKSGLINDFEKWTRSQERQFWLLDLTTDLAVPVAAAVSCGKDGTDYSIGFGAGWTNEAAARSAMGELVQFEASRKLMKDLKKTKQDHLVSVLANPDARMTRYLRTGTARQQPTLGKPVGNMKSLLTSLLEKDLKPVIFRFNENKPSTVRAVIPGLRSLWPRFAPGRLYDVPCETGELSARKKEHELNPVPILY